MRIVKVNSNAAIWEYFGQPSHIVVVTTNSTLNSQGELVMGAGIALEAKKRFPSLPKLMAPSARLGYPYYYHEFRDEGIGCIQTKLHWKDSSPIELVDQSISRFGVFSRFSPHIIYHCPLFGCANGGLNWELDVLPLVAKLPDNVIFYDNRG